MLYIKPNYVSPFSLTIISFFLKTLASSTDSITLTFCFLYYPQIPDLEKICVMYSKMSDLVSQTTSLNRNGRFSVLINQLQITIPIMIILNSAPEFISRHSMIAFAIPTLIGFLQIQAVGTQPSPFRVHPVTAMATVVAVFGYYVSFTAQRWLPTYNSQFGAVMLFLGSFSVASLTSLLLPSSLWEFRFIFYVLLMLPEFLPFIKNIYNYCLHRFRRWQLRRRRVAPPGLLPVTVQNATTEQ